MCSFCSVPLTQGANQQRYTGDPYTSIPDLDQFRDQSSNANASSQAVKNAASVLSRSANAMRCHVPIPANLLRRAAESAPPPPSSPPPPPTHARTHTFCVVYRDGVSPRPRASVHSRVTMHRIPFFFAMLVTCATESETTLLHAPGSGTTFSFIFQAGSIRLRSVMLKGDL